jgi:ribonucleotide reductase beta subunit family protein with ferritin-like domain
MSPQIVGRYYFYFIFDKINHLVVEIKNHIWRKIMISKDRNTLFPIQNRPLWDAYEQQLQSFWTPYEIDFSEDLDDLKKMEKPAQDLILKILAFFAQSDAIVNENLCYRFIQDVNIPEAIQFYNTQIGIEAVHGHTYANMIESYVKNEEEQVKLFKAIDNYPFIAKKAKWMKKWIGSQASFSKRLFAFAVVEGLFFAGSFCSIFWIREKGLMPGLSMANDLIARDENFHRVFAATLYQELVKINNQIKQKEFYISTRLDDESVSDEELGKQLREIAFLKKSTNTEFEMLNKEEIQEIIRDAVKIEKEFITDSLPVSLLGLNSVMMGEYIESVADLILEDFGFDKMYNTRQPFDFMIKNDVRGKVNFFERRSSEYRKATREKVDFEKVSEDF